MADNDMAPTNQATTISHRMRGERTGRMHNIDAARELLSPPLPPLRRQSNDTDGRVRSAMATTDRRMGDMMMAENGTDLLADTSNNESEIHQPPPTFNQSSSSSNDTIVPHAPHSNLAQNLTNYLLKWSLKTLTNLAKKSLESLANRTGSNSNNGFAASETEPDEDPLPNVKLSSPVERQYYLKTATAAAATTTVGTQIDQHRSAFAEGQLSRASSKDYASTSDGFDTHSRPLQRVQQSPGSTARLSTTLAPTSTNAPTVSDPGGTQVANKHGTSQQQQQQQHRLKPANFSGKDTDRFETTKARQLQGSAGRATSVDQQRDYLARSNESGHTRHDRGESAHLAPHGVSWLLIGCLLVLVLLIGLLAIFCLTTSSSYPPLGGHTVINAHHQPLPTHQSAAAAVAGKKVTSLPRLVFSGTIVANERCDVGHQCRRMVETPSGYENYDYNRFENHPRDASASSREGASPASSGTSSSSSSSSGSRGRIGSSATSSSGGDSLSPLGNRQSKSAHHLGPSASVMISSRSTRSSTSVSSASSELDGENNCNNSELLLTEHVLMGANSRANESYA